MIPAFLETPQQPPQPPPPQQESLDASLVNDQDDHEEDPDTYDLGTPPLVIYANIDELKKTIHEFSKSHGYELVIKSGLNNKESKTCRLDFRCKRHGALDNKRKLTDETRKRKKRPSIKTGCKFRLIAAAMKRAEPDGPWQLRHPESGVFAHNHPADEITNLSGHRKRDLADLTDMISVMHRAGITPAQILTVLSQLYKDKAIVAKDVYNIIQASQTQSPYTTPGKRGRPPGPARQSLAAAAVDEKPEDLDATPM